MSDDNFELPNEDDPCEELIEQSDGVVGGGVHADDGGEPIPNPPHNSGH